MRSPAHALALALLMATLGCTKAASTNAGPPSRSRDLITRQQIEALNVVDAYEIVQRLRSDMLRGRGAQSRGRDLPVVYVDGVRRGMPDVLRQIRSGEVQEIRFINGTDATTRWGTDHVGGVIDVKTRSGR